jgi:hypothetical protein
MHGDWVTATATILAAIIGVLGGYFLARYQRERRIVRFLLTDAEDLAAALRAYGDFEIKWSNFSTAELILTSIIVRNIGNQTLTNFSFVVKIPGNHSFAQINCASEAAALLSQISVSPSVMGGLDPEFNVKLPFLNADETLRINALYSGKPSECEVICRLPDTTVQIHKLSDLGRIRDDLNRWKTVLTILSAVVAALALALGGDLLRKLF